MDLLTEDLLKTMKEAGCDDIFFGIESASQEVLNIIEKRFSVQQAKEVVKMTERIGIKTHCSFIIGLPGESEGMIGFFEETKPSGRALPNILEILPGAALHESGKVLRWGPAHSFCRCYEDSGRDAPQVLQC